MRFIINSIYALGLLLALPGLAMLVGYVRGSLDAAAMLHPTGETAFRLMLIAMMIGPAADIWGPKRWLGWLMRRRRWIGVASFIYALAHLAFYAIDMGALEEMLAEIDAPGVWTGWLALFLMMIPALLSNDAAMRWLHARWKRAQRLVYPAVLLTVLHWGLLEWQWSGALIHAAPLLLLTLLRFRTSKGKTA